MSILPRNKENYDKWTKDYLERTKEHRKEWRKEYYKKNRDKAKQYARDKQRRLRLEIFDILGHRCVRCGYGDKRALHFDHVGNNGNKMREKFTSNVSQFLYYLNNKDILVKELQVLCANCNNIKEAIRKEKQLNKE